MPNNKDMSTRTVGDPGMEDATTFEIADIERIAINVVRAAHPGDRWALWEAYQTAAKDAAASCVQFPWESVEEITAIPASMAAATLTAMIEAVDSPAERKRLARIIAREAERLEARIEAGSAPGTGPGKLPMRHCQTCGKPFRPGKPTAKFDPPHAGRRRTSSARQPAGTGNGQPPG